MATPRQTSGVTETTIRPAADWQATGDYHDIRYELAEGMAKIPSTARRCATPSGPRPCSSCADAFNRARDDDTVGVIILTGAGDMAFCSGGDQRIRGDDGYIGDDEVASKGIGRLNVLDLQIQIRRTPKPVVAMIAGYAVGGGHVLHVVCDLSIAADNARFGQTGPKVGSFDGGYGSGLLAANVGQKEGAGDLIPVPPVRRPAGPGHGAGQHRRAPGRAGGGHRPVVPGDAVDVPAGPAHDQGLDERSRRRPGRIEQLAGDATLLFYMSEEAQEGRDAYVQKRKPDFDKFPKRP